MKHTYLVNFSRVLNLGNGDVIETNLSREVALSVELDTIADPCGFLVKRCKLPNNFRILNILKKREVGG